MYDYRRMSRDEQRAIVEHRRQKGFPLHKPPHLDGGVGCYLITAATYEHRVVFDTPSELSALTRRLLEGFLAAHIPVAGWVVMPNHYHLLLHVTELSQVGAVVGPVHGRSAHYANRRDEKPGRQVWYKYTDRRVRSDRHFCTCLHYLIMNPVKHGYCRSPDDWPWSCFHDLLAEHGTQWIENLKHDYPLRDFGKGWDD